MGKTRPASLRDTRPTVGLLTAWVADRYHTTVLSGIADAAAERDADLLCFVGAELHTPDRSWAYSNAVYDLASAENVDGLVILSASMSSHVSLEEIQDFCNRYHPLPVTSIGLALEGIPNIVVDNEKGLRDTITHLIQVHGCSRIAFIRGPEGNDEAQERYRTYVQILEAHGLPLNPDLVTPDGRFDRPWGRQAMRLLLDERKLRPQVDFEAVVAANDAAALGALEQLQAQGIHVPESVAVVGFDDVEDARCITPPLTTVRQPLYEQGRRATEMLFALLEGEQVPEQVTMPTEMVVRRSCGCLSRAAQQILTTGDADAGTVARETTEAALAAQRESLLSHIAQTPGIPPDLTPATVEALLDAFAAEVTGRSPDAFLLAFDSILCQTGLRGGDVTAWHKAISALYRHTLPCLTNDSQALSCAASLCQQARILIGEVAQAEQASQQLHVEDVSGRLTQAGADLFLARDVAELADLAPQQLSLLGIKTCYLCLYDGQEEDPLAWSKLLLAYKEEAQVEQTPTGQRFPSRQLVPDDFLSQEKRGIIVIVPLSHRDMQLGFALFEMPHETRRMLPHALIFWSLGVQISTALRGALLFEERMQAEKALQEAQEQLVRQERLAVLGQLAGGVGHELRNPLAVISNAVYYLRMTLSGADETTGEYLDILSSEVRNVEKIVSDLLDLSRTRPAETEEIAVSELVAGALERQPPPENVKVSTEIGSDLPPVFVDPRQIGQVLDNLVINAYQAMPEGGNLTICAQAERGKTTLSVTDTGCGISREDMDKLFEPLFTTKARGIGLGLVISRNLVKANGGSIEVKSKVGKGSTFTLSLPLRSQGESKS